MKPDRTAPARQSRARQALAQSGGRTVTVKLSKDASEALTALCATGASQQTTISDALVLFHRMACTGAI